ncbi:hypothetical protein SAMD00019534_079340, partial [Acytostelium subglobosum LB1]|uniref:hypothetical protein n=1 Tax=Acytostelium subglobosum LB1 TaxID=1410327 RepID=UPI000644B4F8
VVTLPISIRSLSFGKDYNCDWIANSLPDTITSLSFGKDFNQTISPGMLPTCLTSLTFGDNFYQPIMPGALPQSLITLVMGSNFDHNITGDGIFPYSLRSLTFGTMFNRPFTPGLLPPLLETLQLGRNYTLPLHPHCFPDSLTDLTFPSTAYRENIPQSVLPTSLTRLEINSFKIRLITFPDPQYSKLSTLVLNRRTKLQSTIPSSVGTLIINDCLAEDGVRQWKESTYSLVHHIGSLYGTIYYDPKQYGSTVQSTLQRILLQDYPNIGIYYLSVTTYSKDNLPSHQYQLQIRKIDNNNAICLISQDTSTDQLISILPLHQHPIIPSNNQSNF